MTSGEFRDDQPVLPGFDDLSLALDAFRAEEDAREAADRELDALYAPVHPIQQVILEAHEREVLQPREQIWAAAKNLLATRRPSGLEIEPAIIGQYPNGLGKLHWQLALLDTERELHLQTTVCAPFDLGAPSQGRSESDLHGAIRYMQEGPAAFRRHRLPDELLGVTAEGKGSARHFPAELQDHVLLEALERTRMLQVKVHATALGSGAAKDILDFKVNYPGHRLATMGAYVSVYYLHPENVDAIYDALWSGHGKDVRCAQNPQPSLDDIYNFLHEQYVKPGPGKDYTDLAAVLDLVRRSNVISQE